MAVTMVVNVAIPYTRDNNYRSESYVGDDVEYNTSTLESGGNGTITHADGTQINF